MSAEGRHVVLVTEPLAPEADRWLEQRCIVHRVSGPGADGWSETLGAVDGLIVRTSTKVDADLLSLTPRLRVVARAGVGLDNIDVAACRAAGAEVVYTPDANTQAVVEFVLQLVLSRLRPIEPLHDAVDADEWRRRRSPEHAGGQLSDRTVGILGLGRIGGRLAGAVAGIGATAIYTDVREIPPETRNGASPVPIDELLRRSDVLSVHVDGRSSNRGLLDATRLSALKPGVVLVNTSRGFVVDKTALAAFLREHAAATAVLDVHEPEPIEPGSPLLGLANARLYPHIAARTTTALLAMSWVVRDVVDVLEGRPPRWPAPPTI